MIKTLITLKKNFSLTGNETAAVKEFNEMEHLGYQSKTQKQVSMFEDWSQLVYNNGMPLAFIITVEKYIENVTIWADRKEIETSIKNSGWIKKLKDLETQSNLLSNLDEKEIGFRVEICMPESKHSNYFSINEVESLLKFEDRLSLVTGESDVAKIENLAI